MKISLYLLCLLIVFGFTNTAAQTPTLTTIPIGVSVNDLIGSSLGTSPFDFKNAKENTEFVLKKEGYEPLTISIEKGSKKPLSFPENLNSCGECLFQFANFPKTGKEPYAGSLKMKKKFDEVENSIFIAIDTPKVVIPNDREIGKVNGNSWKMGAKDIHWLLGYPENMNNQVFSPFENSFLEAVFLDIKDSSITNLYKPKIILKPIINEMAFDLNGKLYRDYSGPVMLKIEWNITTIKDPKKILAIIPVTTTFWRTGQNYKILLHQMMEAAHAELLQNDTLHGFLAKLENDYLQSTIGPPLKIKTEKALSFSGTKEMLKAITPAVVTIENPDGFGSGFIISKDGYILTNHHVIKGAKEILVKIGSDKKISAEVVKINSDFDLALLKIKQDNLSCITFENVSTLEAGDEVWAIGTPLDRKLGQTVTKGIISGFRMWNGVHFIQSDVSINSGNSGGPLINEKGEVIGIATLKYFGKGVEGIGFGIPTSEILKMMNLQLE